MKKFKRIYIEITNMCNLSCSFCSKSNCKKQEMNLDQFEMILKKINDYTDYIYLHVKGEPLLHSKLKQILKLCNNYKKHVNITTNGTLIEKQTEILLETNYMRQINFSLHSENNKENYLEEIFSATEVLSTKMNVVYRLWTLKENKFNEKSTKIVDNIASYYKLSPESVDKIKRNKDFTIKPNLYISKANEFIWPNLNNDYVEEKGYCHGLQNQIAILVDGTVVPCCLDSEGVIKLGNIYNETLEEILLKERVKKIIKGFRERKVTEELCKHCSFKNKF